MCPGNILMCPENIPMCPGYIPMCPNPNHRTPRLGGRGEKFSGQDRSTLREWRLLQQEPTNNRLRKPERHTALPGSQKTPVFVLHYVPYENSCFPPYGSAVQCGSNAQETSNLIRCLKLCDPESEERKRSWKVARGALTKERMRQPRPSPL